MVCVVVAPFPETLHARFLGRGVSEFLCVTVYRWRDGLQLPVASGLCVDLLRNGTFCTPSLQNHSDFERFRLTDATVRLEFVVRPPLGAGRGPYSERPNARCVDRLGALRVHWKRSSECGPPMTRGSVPAL